MINSLKERAVNGLFWSFLQRFGTKGIMFVIMILLARLLTPNDFGLIAMIMILVQISQAIIEGGFNLALIQKKEIDTSDYSSVFYINLAVSLILYTFVFLIAPLVATFFNQPILSKLIRVLSLVFIINAFSSVQEAKLTREIRFKTLALIHIPSVVLGGIIGLVMALEGWGVWSLVYMQLSTRFAYSAQIWLYSKWYPDLFFNRKRAKVLFSFGSKVLISNVITAIYNNIFVVAIGKFYPLNNVGYYQNASNLAITPASTISSVLWGVSFPVFSQIQEDDIRLKDGFKRLMQISFFVTCPIFVSTALLATPLFKLVLGVKWLPAVPYFRWLCIVGALYPLNIIKLSIVNIKGRSDVFLRMEVIRRVTVTIAIAASLILLTTSIKALLIIQASEYIFMFLLFGHYCGSFIKYSILEQIQDLSSILMLNLSLGIVTILLMKLLSFLPSSALCMISIGTGILFYLGFAALFRVSSFIELRDVLLNRIRLMFK